MDKRHLLWTLVAVDVLLAFGSVGAEAFFGWTLPPALAEYERARFSSFSISSPGDVLQLLLIVTTSLLAFAAWIGLASFWRYGRELFLVSLATWILCVLFAGDPVKTSVGAVFSALDALVAGMLIALVYFSDLARRFERPRITQAGLGAVAPDRA